MTNNRISIVQKSFAHALPHAERVARRFYARLFTDAPYLRALFAPDMAAQEGRLIVMLTMIVGNLHRIDTVLPATIEMARRHVGYGVEDAHYALVGTALIETLREVLGQDFTSDVEAAWRMAYDDLAEAMIAGTRTPSAIGAMRRMM